MKNFTLGTYKQLLQILISKNYHFFTVEEYFSIDHSVSSSPIRSFAPSQSRSVSNSLSRPLAILRHDVDRKPQNALRMAKLESDMGIKATYYFRTIPKTFKPEIIKEIAGLAHEIGYHYENLAEANSRMKNLKLKMKNEEDFKEKLFELAITDFEKNLSRLREIVPIKNIAMHGRPTSKWDSRDLWKKYNYKDYGIVSEPYFDLDFSQVQYITDAGRSWDNSTINLRDIVDSPFPNSFKHTNDIIRAAKKNQLSELLMFNIHPEHWAASLSEWLKIWAIRKVKNGVKRVVLRRRWGADER